MDNDNGFGSRWLVYVWELGGSVCGYPIAHYPSKHYPHSTAITCVLVCSLKLTYTASSGRAVIDRVSIMFMVYPSSFHGAQYKCLIYTCSLISQNVICLTECDIFVEKVLMGAV